MKQTALDKYDINILSVLQKEGRISKRGLAERINLSPTPCLRRIENLEKRGYIEGYHADINYERLGRYRYITAQVSLHSHRVDVINRFHKAVMATPEIIECYAVVGGEDYIMKFLVKSDEHYQKIFENLLMSGVGIVKHRSHIRKKIIKRNSDNSFSSLRDCIAKTN